MSRKGLYENAANCKKNAEQPEDCSASSILIRLLHAVFVCLDHLFDHLAADRAGLTAGEFAVITVFQVDADFLNVSDTS